MSEQHVPKTVAEVQKHFSPDLDEENVARIREIMPHHLWVCSAEDRHHAWCDSCGSFVRIDKSRHRGRTICPACLHEAEVIHTWRGCKTLRDRMLLYIYGTSAIDTEILTVQAVYVEMDWGPAYEDGVMPWQVEPDIYVDSRSVFVYGKGAATIRPAGGCRVYNAAKPIRYEICKPAGPRWYVYMNLGYAGLPFYVDADSLDEAVAKTPFRYIWEAVGDDFLHWGMRGAYLRFFTMAAHYPFATECLAKLGQLTREYLFEHSEQNNQCGHISINWRGKTVAKVLRGPLTKAEKKWLRETSYRNVLFLEAWQYLRRGGCQSISMMDMVRYGMVSVNLLEKLSAVIKLPRLLRYLKRQQERNGGRKITVDVYRDYIWDCRRLDVDLTEKSNLMPRNLLEMHRMYHEQVAEMLRLEEERHRVEQGVMKLRQDRAKEKAWQKRRKAIVRKYSFEAGGMTIYVPQHLKELITEGAAMHSCVGGYVDRVAAGETIVVFIRKADDLKERIGTMEIAANGAFIVQARAKFNRPLPPEAQAFVDRFNAVKIERRERESA
jgi:hypothetical protein|nr:MAG TPA: PcfJ like protein [Caudoviricetes sp.]